MSGESSITRRGAADLAQALQGKQLSAVEVTQAHLARIQAVDGAVHAFLHVAADEALAAAQAVDADRAAGVDLPPLAGVPIAVKDVMATQGLPTTCGSAILRGWVPPYDATVVRRIKDARMVILGKTNMDEFAMGSSTEHSAYGPTHNPWDLDRIPGGSGGGSAAALASFEAPLATGTDTGGSIRQPASVTGTVGVKPTYGAVSRYGLVALASSLDQAGPCARTVLDAALLHEVMAGHDPMDSTSLTGPYPDVVAAARRGAAGGLDGLTVGVVRELGGEGYQAGVAERFEQAVALLTEAGAKVVEVSCPSFTAALGAYYLILPSEASSNLAKFDAMRYGLRVYPEGVDDPTAEQVMAATREAGLRRRGQAPDHPGHLRPLLGLLRRLLRQRAEGAHADPARLHRGVRPGRRAGLTDRTDHGVPPRRQAGRPAGDVPERRRDHPGQPGRNPRHVPAQWSGRRGRAADRAADPGSGDVRRPALPGRRRARGSTADPLGCTTSRPGPGAGLSGVESVKMEITMKITMKRNGCHSSHFHAS